jgi:hypothetical protein
MLLQGLPAATDPVNSSGGSDISFDQPTASSSTSSCEQEKCVSVAHFGNRVAFTGYAKCCCIDHHPEWPPEAPGAVIQSDVEILQEI